MFFFIVGAPSIDQYVCSHMRAVDYFVESINSFCPFSAFSCSSWDSFTKYFFFQRNRILQKNIVSIVCFFFQGEPVSRRVAIQIFVRLLAITQGTTQQKAHSISTHKLSGRIAVSYLNIRRKNNK